MLRRSLILAIGLGLATWASPGHAADESPNWNIRLPAESQPQLPARDNQNVESSSDPTAEIGFCRGSTYRPDIVYQPPTYRALVAGTASQTCSGTYILHRVCAKIAEYNYGLNRWVDVTNHRCSAWTRNDFITTSVTKACDEVGVGQFRTSAKGEVEVRSGLLRRYGYSAGVILCN